MGVDIIEAGFPVASPDDFQAVKVMRFYSRSAPSKQKVLIAPLQTIAETVGTSSNPPIICGLARATKNDIETCARAVQVG